MRESCVTFLSRATLRRARKTALTALAIGVFASGALAADSAHPNSEQARLDALLQDAVRAGKLATVRTVVTAGANVTALDAKGRSPLDLAIAGGQFEIVNYLMLARRLQHRTVATASSSAKKPSKKIKSTVAAKPKPAAKKQVAKISPPVVKQQPAPPKIVTAAKPTKRTVQKKTFRPAPPQLKPVPPAVGPKLVLSIRAPVELKPGARQHLAALRRAGNRSGPDDGAVLSGGVSAPVPLVPLEGKSVAETTPATNARPLIIQIAPEELTFARVELPQNEEPPVIEPVVLPEIATAPPAASTIPLDAFTPTSPAIVMERLNEPAVAASTLETAPSAQPRAPVTIKSAKFIKPTSPETQTQTQSQMAANVADKLALAATKLAGAIEQLATVTRPLAPPAQTQTAEVRPTEASKTDDDDRPIHFYPSRKPSPPVQLAEIAPQPSGKISNSEDPSQFADAGDSIAPTMSPPLTTTPSNGSAAAVVPDTPEPTTPAENAAEAEQARGLVARLLSGFGGFFGSETARTGDPAVDAPGETTEVAELSPAEKLRNTPAPPPAPKLPKALAEVATAADPLPIEPLNAKQLNPYNPDNAPLGSTLAVTDPLAGEQPEIPTPEAVAVAALKAKPDNARSAAQNDGEAAPARRARRRIARRSSGNFIMDSLREDQDTRRRHDARVAATARGRQTKSQAERPTGTNRRILRAPVKRLRPPLKGVRLALGNDAVPGMQLAAEDQQLPHACLQKFGRNTHFCIIEIDWPESVRKAFAVNTILYQGSRAVTRFDAGRASHFHALFDTEAQQDVVDWARKKFGPPTDFWRRTIAPFGKPRKKNPTYVWRSTDPDTKRTTVLEVRKFDDSRNVFPDTKHGSVRLYVAGGPPVFPAVTSLDIMSIDWAARSDPTDGSTSDAAIANTLPVRR